MTSLNHFRFSFSWSKWADPFSSGLIANVVRPRAVVSANGHSNVAVKLVYLHKRTNERWLMSAKLFRILGALHSNEVSDTSVGFAF